MSNSTNDLISILQSIIELAKQRKIEDQEYIFELEKTNLRLIKRLEKVNIELRVANRLKNGMQSKHDKQMEHQRKLLLKTKIMLTEQFLNRRFGPDVTNLIKSFC